MIKTREIVTAFVYGDQARLVSPDGSVERTRAEYSAFLKCADVSDSLVRKLGASQRVLGTQEEGEWIRVLFRDYQCRREVVEDFLTKKLNVKVYEGDVPPIRRILSDYPIHIAKPRVAWLDIEADSRVRFKFKHLARVLTWTVVLADGKCRKRALEHDSDNAERALIKELHDTLAEFADCTAVWGSPVSEAYDYEVLDARAQLHRMRWRPRRVMTVDFLKVWEKMNRMAAESGDEKASLKLEEIALATLGRGKFHTPPEVIEKFGNKSMGALSWDLWAAGGKMRETLLHYNWLDTDLMRQLEAKKGYFNLFNSVCEVANCLPETKSLNTTVQMDGYLLRHGAQAGIHWPTKPRDVQGGKQYKGAMVMKPNVRGIERDVHVFDFKSMYPTIMLTWNMSPETIIVEGDGYKGPFCEAPTGARFRTDKPGIIAGVVDELLRRRGEWKKKKSACAPGTPEWHLADARTAGYKTLTNGFYGGIGAPYSRFFNRTIAEAITQTGVWLIKHTIEKAELPKWAFRTLYADTDGGYFQGGTRASASAFAAHCNEHLYPKLAEEKGCTNNQLGVSYEKAFRIIVWPRSSDGKFASKRYAGKYAHYEGVEATIDSEPETKGLEIMRGDTPRLARRMQGEVIDLLIKQECEDVVEFAKLISKWRTHILEGPLEREDIVMSNALSKDPDKYDHATPHVAVARMMKERGDDVSEGTRIEFVVVSTNPMKAIPAEEFTGENFDRKYMWNNRVWPPSARLLRGALPGENWDAWLVKPPKLKGGKLVPANQTKMFAEGEPAVGRLKRRKGEVTLRIDHQRGLIFGKLKQLLEGAPGKTRVVVEIIVPKGTAVLDAPQLIDLTPTLERALRTLGVEIFV